MEINLPIEKNHPVFKPTVLKLGLVSFFADISSEMLYPITPIFLTLVLGASPFQVGVIEGLAEGVASLLKVYSGALSDRFRQRKIFILAGYFLAAVAKPWVGQATSWWHVLLARSTDRLGKGIRSAPRDALLSESVSAEYRGAAFGWHRMMDTLGAALGPLLTLMLLYFFQKTSQDINFFRSIYFYAFIPGLLAVLVVLWVHEPDRQPIVAAADPFQQSSKWMTLNPSFKVFLFSWTLFSLANSSDVFLILKAQQSGVSLQSTILMYVFYNLVYSLLSPYLGGLSDRIGRRPLLVGGLFVFALIYLSFGWADQIWQFWVLFATYGLYMAATDGVSKAYIVDLIPAEQKATGLGLFGTVVGVSTIFASTMTGYLWSHFGVVACFSWSATLAALAAVVLLLKRSNNCC